MVAGYSSRNPYIQALNTSSSYHGRSMSPLPYSSRVYETPRTTTTVTNYHTPNYSYSSRTTRSTSVTPPTIRQRTASPGIPHVAHQRLTPSVAPPRTANLYLDDLELVGGNGKYVSTISKYDDDVSKPLLDHLTEQTSDLRAQMNSVLAKIHDSSHLKGVSHTYPVPGFSGRGERTGTERPGRTGGYADSSILGPMRDVHHDVHNMSRYEEPGKKLGIGKGHLACMEFAGGKPVLKRRQKFYDDEKIPLEIKILANLNGKPRHERRKPVEPSFSIRDDGYVPWRERLAKDLTYVPPEPQERELVPEPEPHNPDRNWELPQFETPKPKLQKQEEETNRESSRVVDPEPTVAEVVVENKVEEAVQPEKAVVEEPKPEPESVAVVEEVVPKKEKRKKKSKVEEAEVVVEAVPAPPAEPEVPEVQVEEQPKETVPVVEEPPAEPEAISIPHVYVESDIEDIAVSHENADGYDEHVRSENEQVFHLDHRFMSSDEGGSPLPITPQTKEWIENPLVAELASLKQDDALLTEEEPVETPLTEEPVEIPQIEEPTKIEEPALAEEPIVQNVESSVENEAALTEVQASDIVEDVPAVVESVVEVNNDPEQLREAAEPTVAEDLVVESTLDNENVEVVVDGPVENDSKTAEVTVEEVTVENAVAEE